LSKIGEIYPKINISLEIGRKISKTYFSLKIWDYFFLKEKYLEQNIFFRILGLKKKLLVTPKNIICVTNNVFFFLLISAM
jgi:hypothetical protein